MKEGQYPDAFGGFLSPLGMDISFALPDARSRRGRGEGCRIPGASRILPGCLEEILKDTMEKGAGTYVTDVGLTFQKAVLGRKVVFSRHA